jgi:hypothetical protein
MGEAHTLKQAKQIEFGLRTHFIEHIGCWKIGDLDQHIGAEVAKLRRQVLPGRFGQAHKIIDRWSGKAA